MKLGARWVPVPLLGVLLVGGLLCACGGRGLLGLSGAQGVEIVDSDSVLDFHSKTSAFYQRLAKRRFNTRATYRDERLRGYFRSEAAFADYYAELAQALADSVFERNRPLALEVVEFFFEAPQSAVVRVRIRGDDGRPLRFGAVSVEREDRWERLDGSWWIVPGKL